MALAAAQPVAAKLITSSYFTEMVAPHAAQEARYAATIDHDIADQITRFSGLGRIEIAALSLSDRAKILTIFDPDWQKRRKIADEVRLDLLKDIYVTVEPQLRGAYAKALARIFTANELTDINSYLSTPTGLKFAAHYFQLSNDRNVWMARDAAISRVVAERPRIEAAVRKATARLAMPRKVEEMTSQQRAELVMALGIDPAKLKDGEIHP